MQERIVDQFQIAGQLETILGSRAATYVLLFIESYGSGYGAEIASTFDIPINSVQQQLRKFEVSGVLISYVRGKTRIYEFNPRGTTVRNLRQFLAEELTFMRSEYSNIPPEIYQRLFLQRTRPRRSGKRQDTVPERLRK
jgi:predicted transcriptional regulator